MILDLADLVAFADQDDAWGVFGQIALFDAGVGDQDQLVPIHNSTNMLAAFQEVKVPSKLITIEGGGHGFSGDDAQRAAKAWVDWFDQHLLGK